MHNNVKYLPPICTFANMSNLRAWQDYCAEKGVLYLPPRIEELNLELKFNAEERQKLAYLREKLLDILRMMRTPNQLNCCPYGH